MVRIMLANTLFSIAVFVVQNNCNAFPQEPDTCDYVFTVPASECGGKLKSHSTACIDYSNYRK